VEFDRSCAEVTLQPVAEAVHWFGSSRRLVGGRPDTRYGWMELPDGACIVKALAVDLASHVGTLLGHEREVLRRLRDAGAPVPEVVPSERADWLVTRFAGPSLAMLERCVGAGAPLLSAEETVAAWAAFLARATALDEAGALPLDLRSANLVLPLARRAAGQPLLNAPVLVDHAHTLVAGLDLRRPAWIDRHMPQVAPELRAALMHDQEALIGAFRRAGAALPGHEGADEAALERSRRLWAEYDAPQSTQQLVDGGRLDRGAAMQYAVGVALRAVVRRAGPALAAPLAAVTHRLCADEPSARFGSAAEAAAALRGLLPAIPMASRRSLPALDGTWMATAWRNAGTAAERHGARLGSAGSTYGLTPSTPPTTKPGRQTGTTAHQDEMSERTAPDAIAAGATIAAAPTTGSARGDPTRAPPQPVTPRHRLWRLALAAGTATGVWAPWPW
jgi:hypothetical protein